MEYKIIKSESIDELSKKVEELIQHGWTLVGSHQVVVYQSTNRYSGGRHVDTLHSVEYSQTVISYYNPVVKKE